VVGPPFTTCHAAVPPQQSLSASPDPRESPRQPVRSGGAGVWAIPPPWGQTARRDSSGRVGSPGAPRPSAPCRNPSRSAAFSPWVTVAPGGRDGHGPQQSDLGLLLRPREGQRVSRIRPRAPAKSADAGGLAQRPYSRFDCPSRTRAEPNSSSLHSRVVTKRSCPVASCSTKSTFGRRAQTPRRTGPTGHKQKAPPLESLPMEHPSGRPDPAGGEPVQGLGVAGVGPAVARSALSSLAHLSPRHNGQG